MGRLGQFGLQSLALTICLVGCSTSSLMDATDDMGGSTSGGNGSGSNSACSACFEKDCAWQVTECAAEPDCAKWLTCAQSVPASSSGGADAAWLRDSCNQEMGPTASTLRDTLASCLVVGGCCTGAGEADVGAVGADSGGANYGEDGSNTVAPGGPNGDGWDCPSGECGCEECLFALKHGEIEEQAECTTAVQQCVESAECSRYFTGFLACAAGASTDDANTDTASQKSLAACLFAKAHEDGGGEGFEQFVSSVYGCATGFCRSYCVPEDAQSCVQCQQTWCEGELEALLTDSDAVMGSWCRAYCQVHPEDAACPDLCAPHLEASQETLGLFGQCVQTSCGDDC